MVRRTGVNREELQAALYRLGAALRKLAEEMLADGDDYVGHYGRRLRAILDGHDDPGPGS